MDKYVEWINLHTSSHRKHLVPLLEFRGTRWKEAYVFMFSKALRWHLKTQSTKRYHPPLEHLQEAAKIISLSSDHLMLIPSGFYTHFLLSETCPLLTTSLPILSNFSFHFQFKSSFHGEGKYQGKQEAYGLTRVTIPLKQASSMASAMDLEMRDCCGKTY